MIVALAGGVGGAKLALGLAAAVPPADLTVIVNTGDDFRHLGLAISPDLDTVMYTLAGIENPELGWGQRGETWEFMGALERLGGETWFRLGDRDMATHIERTQRLAAGEPLSAVTRQLCERLSVGPHIVPMTDDEVATVVETNEGTLAFQHYFVRRRCEPRVTAIRYDGAATATASPAAFAALSDPSLEAIVICPSNPYLSIAPMLALFPSPLRGEARGEGTARISKSSAISPSAASGGTSPAGREEKIPIVAVSPIVGGKAIKGPAAKIMTELGHDASALGVARHYAGRIDGIVIDEQDSASADAIAALGLAVHVTDTIMRDLASKRRLAEETLAFARRLAAARAGSPS